MRLHHTTTRSALKGIAAAGFIDPGRYAPAHEGAWMTSSFWVNGTVGIEEGTDGLSPDAVVIAFDIPDEVAATYQIGVDHTVYPPGHPDYDPTIGDQQDDIGGPNAEDMWVILVDLANRHFAAVVHWTGDHPLTVEEMELMRRRSVGGATAG